MAQNKFMTEEKMIMAEIYGLPENLKTEVLDFIEFLKQQHNIQAKTQNRTKRIFGSAKGKYTLAPDFDAPLADFEEYM